MGNPKFENAIGEDRVSTYFAFDDVFVSLPFILDGLAFCTSDRLHVHLQFRV
jgi:hypothetical protein